MKALMGLLLLAAAGASVEYDHQVDFSRYSTWSWGQVTPAMNPVTDKRIREAIEGGLATRGLSRVESHATLLVTYRTERTSKIDAAGPKPSSPSPDPDSRYFEKATLAIDMTDPASGKVVWHGRVTGALKYGPKEIAEVVKTAVDDLLSRFPPAPAGPSPSPAPASPRGD